MMRWRRARIWSAHGYLRELKYTRSQAEMANGKPANSSLSSAHTFSMAFNENLFVDISSELLDRRYYSFICSLLVLHFFHGFFQCEKNTELVSVKADECYLPSSTI